MTSIGSTTRAPEIGYDGTTTSWLPMSTAWPEKTECETLLFKFVPQILAGWDPGYELFVDNDAKCLPPQMMTWWDADKLSLGIDSAKTKLSIGPIVCPEAYTTATTVTNAGKSTFVGCCPSSYRFVSVYDVGDVGQCASQLKVGSTVEYMTRNSQSEWVATSSVVEASSSWAFAIPLNGWLFPDSSPTSTSTSTIATGAASTTAESTNTASATETSTSAPDSGLSTGAKAGIGIGVALGVLAVAAVVGALLFRRRKQKRATAPNNGEEDHKDTHNYPSEMYGSTPKDRVAVAELPEGRSRPVELP